MSLFLAEAPGAKAVRLLTDWIKEGILVSGSLLPSERQLSQKMEVSLTTVKRAIKMLEDEGLIERRGERRRVIAGQGKAGALSLLGNAIVIIVAAPTQFTAPSSAPDGRPVDSGAIAYIANGACNAVQTSGLHSLVLHPEIMVGEELEHLLEQGPRGAIISEFSDQSGRMAPLLQALRRAKIPFVVFGNNPEYQEYDRVVSDHEAGGYQLTQWLIGRGCRRILCTLPSTGNYWAQARHDGYLRAMREGGIKPLPLLDQVPILVQTENREHLFKVMSQYMAGCLLPYFREGAPLDAILATNDWNAFEISAACRSLRKPSDPEILIAGYDNSLEDCWEREGNPGIPVATVDKQNYEMGQELARLLLDRINDQLPAAPQIRIVPPVLIPFR